VSTGAIVLAAGSSARLGRPKALVDFDGRTALHLVLGALRAAGVVKGVVVVGEDAAAIERAVDVRPFELAGNPEPAAGRTGSIQVGLNALAAAGGGRDSALLWPVDRPLASTSTLGAILAAAAQAGDDVGWVAPRCDGRRGHPVLLRAAVLPFVRRAGPGESLRDVLRASGLGALDVPVDDAGIHVDIDTADDAARALAWWRGRSPER
jgi:molybdenum cofactor cytidylyltransferase